MSAAGNECFAPRRTAFNFIPASFNDLCARLAECVSNPLANCQVFAPGHGLDIRHLCGLSANSSRGDIILGRSLNEP